MPGESATILALHRAAFEVPINEFRHHAFSLLHQTLPFDTGSWGTGWLDGAGILTRDVELHGQSTELLASYSQIKSRDFLVQRARRHPGETQSLKWTNAALMGPPDEQFRLHCRSFEFDNILTTLDALESNYYAFVTLARSRQSRAFSEEDLNYKQRIMPHLIQAWASNFAWHNDSIAEDGAMSALSTANGKLIGAKPHFMQMLESEWGHDFGGHLRPDALRSLLRTEKWCGDQIALQSTPLAGMLVISLRRLDSDGPLTKREIEVAHHASEGLSYKEIARKLNVSPGTVRQHLHKIYGKLGVANKTALSRLFNKRRRSN